MPTLYFSRGGETLADLVNEVYAQDTIDLHQQCAYVAEINHCSGPKPLPAQQVIVLPDAPTPEHNGLDTQAQQLALSLGPKEQNLLGQLLDNTDDDTLLAIMEAFENFQADDGLKAMAGGLFTVAKARGTPFNDALMQYRQALIDYANHPGSKRRLMSRQVKQTFTSQ